jgi:hypothetical protein
MSFRSETYRVLIASPSDLHEERQVAADAIANWNAEHAATEGVVFLPVTWETHAMPQTAVRPQEAINQQLVRECDVLMGMFWTKLGTHTGVAESGTVEEIDEFVAAGKPTLLYFSRRLVDPSGIDIDQLRKLREFKEETYKTALTGTFASLDELRQILLRDLTRLVRTLKPKTTSTATPEAATTRTLSAAKQAEFSRLLKRDFPSGGLVYIHIISVQFRLLAAALEAAFQLAGWQTTYSNRPLDTDRSSHTIKYSHGVEIRGYNETTIGLLRDICREVGIFDLETTLQEPGPGIGPDHPKWERAQTTAYIFIGHKRE